MEHRWGRSKALRMYCVQCRRLAWVEPESAGVESALRCSECGRDDVITWLQFRCFDADNVVPFERWLLH